MIFMMKKETIRKEKKYLNQVRLPFVIPFVACVDLFVAGVFSVPLFFAENWFALALLAGFSLPPALAALTVYANYIILFDKERILYRDIKRRSRLFTYDDIRDVREKEGVFSELFTDEGKIPVANADRNGRWLMELALKQKGVPPKERRKETEIALDAKLDIIVGIIGALFFAVLCCFLHVDETGRTMFHLFLLFVFFCLSCSVYGCVLIHRDKRETPDEYGRYGRYLIHRKGHVVSGWHDKTFRCGFVFLLLGFVLNGLTVWFYAAGAFCMLLHAVREYRVRFLYRCPEPYVRRVLADHRPSPRLEAKLPEHYRKYVDPAIVLDSMYWDLEEEEEEEKLKNWTNPVDTESPWIFWGKIVMTASLVPAIVAVCILCNYILFDARPGHTVEFDSTLSLAENEGDDREERLSFYIAEEIPDTDAKILSIPVSSLGEDDLARMKTDMERGETFHLKLSTIETGSPLLSVEDEEGRVLFSEEDSREALIRSMTPWLRRFAVMAAIVFLIGGTMSAVGFFKGPVEETAEEDTEEEDWDDAEDYARLWEDEGAKRYRGNFHSGSLFDFWIRGCMVILFLFFAVLLVLEIPFGKEFEQKNAVKVETRIVEHYPGESVKGFYHYMYGEDWVAFKTENGTVFWVRRFYRYVDDLDALNDAVAAGETFTFLVYDQGKIDEMDAYSVTDENGHCYYSTEDADRAYRGVQWHIVLHYGIPMGLILLDFLLAFLMMRYAEKMPSFLVAHFAKCGSPAKHLADALGDDREKLRKRVLLEIEKDRKEAEAEMEKARKKKEKEKEKEKES